MIRDLYYGRRVDTDGQEVWAVRVHDPESRAHPHLVTARLVAAVRLVYDDSGTLRHVVECRGATITPSEHKTLGAARACAERLFRNLCPAGGRRWTAIANGEVVGQDGRMSRQWRFWRERIGHVLD